MDNILSIRQLYINYCPDGQNIPILDNVSFDVPKGRVLGITGSSGSGKSMTALALMGLANFFDDVIVSGKILYHGKDLNDMSKSGWSSMRGKNISLILQHPEAALNPVKKIGDQLVEALHIHQPQIKILQHQNTAFELLSDVGLTENERIFEAFPHELSGGQLQRIVIAMAIAHKPEIIIADEATSSLDANTSDEIIRLLLSIKEKFGSALVFITHDITLLKDISDHILLLKNGVVADYFAVGQWNEEKISKETKQYLLAGNFKERAEWAETSDLPTLKVKEVTKTYYQSSWKFWKAKIGKKVLNDITLTLRHNVMLGICGPSGSGKTTLAKIISGIFSASSGEIYFQNQPIFPLAFKKSKHVRKNVQMVMQDALTSMNPKMTIRQQWSEIIDYYRLAPSKKSKSDSITKLLDEFSLPESVLEKYPVQLSGGQRQRAALARTLLLEPELVIFDESLSALDVFTQQKMIEMIIDLQEKRKFSGIFITHDPKLIKALCHEVVIIENGTIIQRGHPMDVLN